MTQTPVRGRDLTTPRDHDVPGGRDVLRVLTGTAGLAAAAPALDALQQDTACPVTARRPWQQLWCRHHPEVTPLVVVLERPDGQLDAAAPLGVRRRRGLATVVPLGEGASDAVRLPARSASAALALSVGVRDALHALGGPWVLRLRNLEPQDAVVGALAEALLHAAVDPGAVSPRLGLGAERTLRAHVSRNHHQQSRRMHNRLGRAGLQVQVAQLRTAAEAEAVHAEVERVCEARDLQLRGFSSLERPADRAFLRDVVAQHAAAGTLRLTTLRVQGALAAYVLSFQDGAVRRMWNCRLDPAWQEYGVGRLAHDAALEDALAEPGCSTYDWMLGEEAYKAGLADTAHRAVDLTGASNLALWLALRAQADARRHYRAVRDGDGPLAVTARRAQPRLQRWTGLS